MLLPLFEMIEADKECICQKNRNDLLLWQHCFFFKLINNASQPLQALGGRCSVPLERGERGHVHDLPMLNHPGGRVQLAVPNAVLGVLL